MALARQMGKAVRSAAGERHEFLSRPVGVVAAQWFRGDRRRRKGRRHGGRFRPVAGRGVRAGPAQCLYARWQGGAGGHVHQLPDADARPRQWREGSRRRESGKNRDPDSERALPARCRQGDHRASAGPRLWHPPRRAGVAGDPYRRHVADRGKRRPRHDWHHVVFQQVAAGSARPHADILLRLPAFHAGRRGKLAAIRLLRDPSREAEIRRGDARHRAHGRSPDDRIRASMRRRRPKTAASSPA